MKKKSKLDYVGELTKAWMAYYDVVANWVGDIDRLGLSAVTFSDWVRKDDAYRTFETRLLENNITHPDIGKYFKEVEDAALPILEFLFGPNEIACIPELPTWCPGSFKAWLEQVSPIQDAMFNRIIGARNRISASELKNLKTQPKLIPRSGWSNPYPITHWAKVFNISRKTMQNWLENKQLIARKIGSKWQIACEELPAADDKDTTL